MALHKGLLTTSFPLQACEKHFHDHDETWLILSGSGTAYWMDHDGRREEFPLAAGDVWMIPAGYEHGLERADPGGLAVTTFYGTIPPGAHAPGHYYMEKEGYVPSLQLVKTPTARYKKPDVRKRMMSRAKIEFKEVKGIPPDLLQRLFRREEWNDFLDLDEVESHLNTALYLVSAWDEQELAGYARLEGDGKIWVEISDVLVKSEYQGCGIGTELVRRLVACIKKLDPYHIQVAPISDREAHLYGKFGFHEIPYYRRMELVNDKLTRKVAEVRSKRKESNIEQRDELDKK